MNALLLSFDLLLLIQLSLYAYFYHRFKGKVFEFDWGAHKASFPALHVPYREVAFIVFISAMAYAYLDYRQGLGVSALVLVFAAMDALLFNVLMTVFYEAYLHTKWAFSGDGKSNYTGSKYALVWTLGISAIVYFVVGGLSGIILLASK